MWWAVAAVAWAGEPVHLLAGGDVISHVDVVASANLHGWDSAFAPIKATVSAADLAFVNLETPVAPETDGRTAVKVFNAPVELPRALRDAGFDALSIANNHVWDQGRPGLVETVGHLESLGIAYAGAGRTCADATAPRILERKGIRFGWIAATRVHNLYYNREPGDPCVFAFDPKAISAQAAVARQRGAEIVVLSVHWGQEYETVERSWEDNFSKMLVAGGVDVIFGSHPHVIQPVKWVESGGRRGLVAYSLGNLLSGQGWGAGTRAVRRDGALFDVTVERVNGVATVTGGHILPTSTEHGAVGCVGEPARVRTELLSLAFAAAKADSSQAACASYYRERWAAIRKAAGAAWVDAGPER